MSLLITAFGLSVGAGVLLLSVTGDVAHALALGMLAAALIMLGAGMAGGDVRDPD